MEHEHTHHMEAQETSATFTNEVLENDQGSEDHVHGQHGLHDGISYYIHILLLINISLMWFRYGYDENVFPRRLSRGHSI